MKNLLVASATALSLIAAPVMAQGQSNAKADVVERDASGKATKISIEGKTYAVCTPQMQDDCINPREAGLNFGNVPINYWPGQPASEIDRPLPQNQPRN